MTDPYEPIQRRDPFAGINDGGRKPSIEGRDTLAWAMAELVPQKKAPKHNPWWKRWLKWWFKRPKRLALFLVADLVLGSIGWHYLFGPNPGAVAKAMESIGSAASHNDWSKVYSDLCANDRAQISESDLEGSGRAAMASIGFLDHVTVTSVRTVHQSLGPISLPAAQVSGMLVPVVGTPSAYTMTLVHELSGWHVCFSAGGYSSTALNVSAPLGSGFTP